MITEPELALCPGDFAAFFSEVHDGADPFAWQLDLLGEVVARRGWPDEVRLPTGSGKTTLIDLAVFLLALDAGLPRMERWMPRRVVFVVDRRVVVDQAADHAGLLARNLARADSGVVGLVASQLRGLTGGDEPLQTGTLRGGIVRDESWARRPDTAAVLSGTVDQVGSRLLFRGYGLSGGMRPVHAGLLANDVLYLLDEVHLSQPFAETLRAVSRYRTWADETACAPDRWGVVTLSATPPRGQCGAPRWSYPSEPLDPASSPILRRRILANKPVTLEEVKVSSGSRAGARDPFVRACASKAMELLGHPHVRTLGVVVNRVDTARAIWRQLSDVLSNRGPRRDEPGTRAELVTGRMRPIEREELMIELDPYLRMGRAREAGARQLVVVATQCLEAGADYDFDGLVTECASLDALRQRFGRVDRDGLLSELGTPAPGVVITRSSDLALEADDPVYGAALASTFRWLDGLDTVDFGIGALPVDTAPRETETSRPHAPVLFPAHLDAWVQTSPRPTPDPDVSRWLHGTDEVVQDVQVVWRADLTADLLAQSPEDALAQVAFCPPVSLEAATVPLPAVRRWLQGASTDAVADVEGAIDLDAEAKGNGGSSAGSLDETEGLEAAVDLVSDEESAAGRIVLEGGGLAPPELNGTANRADGLMDAPGIGPRLAVRWIGSTGSVVKGSALKPGDVVLVPTAYGGLTSGSWDPESAHPVRDLALEAQLIQRRRAVVRLVPSLWEDAAADVDIVRPPEVDENSELAPRQVVVECLHQLDQCLPHDSPRRTALHHLARLGSRVLIRRFGVQGIGVGEAYFVTSRQPLPSVAAQEEGEPVGSDGEEDLSSFAGSPVLLDAHLKDVERWCEQLALACGLPAKVAGDLALAGRLHDLGKVDPRFQMMLRGGNDIDMEPGAAPLAKSGTSPADRQARVRARQLSGYPSGCRHELLSLAMIKDGAEVRGRAGDWDLVCHLVASHHGYCRPFAPVVLDGVPLRARHILDIADLEASVDHGLARLGSGVPERFWRLVRRYGWFHLAWLEAILRLADHRASEAEQRHADA